MIQLDPHKLPSVTFACGPAQGLASVRQSELFKTLFERSHRAADISYNGLYKETEDHLRDLLQIPQDYTVMFFPGGATPAMDAVLWSLTDKNVSGLNMGAFSRLWCQQLATRIPGINTHFLDVDFIPQTLPDTTADLVILTPNETSTGVQLPDDYLQEVWQKRSKNTLVAWDTTSCAGGRVLPPQAYDIQLFGLQKCFAAGGGTCALILSPKAVQRAQDMVQKRSIPFFLDLTKALEFAQQKHQTLNTPSTINIWMANEAARWMLANGGLKEMENLCKTHANYLVHWAQQTDWITPLVAEEKYRSFTTLTMKITHPQIQDKQINEALAATGILHLQDGLKKYRTVSQNSLRIACFPFVDEKGIEEYKKLTAALDEIAQQLKNQIH